MATTQTRGRSQQSPRRRSTRPSLSLRCRSRFSSVHNYFGVLPTVLEATIVPVPEVVVTPPLKEKGETQQDEVRRVAPDLVPVRSKGVVSYSYSEYAPRSCYYCGFRADSNFFGPAKGKWRPFCNNECYQAYKKKYLW